jgi:hypothetical protein
MIDAAGPQELDMTMWLPGYDPKSGRLRPELQFTARACYACSDGRWDSYTVSTTVTSERVPAALESYETLPAPVRDWWSETIVAARESGGAAPSPAPDAAGVSAPRRTPWGYSRVTLGGEALERARATFRADASAGGR